MKFFVELALKIRSGLNKCGDYGYISEKEMRNNISKIIHQTYHSKVLPFEIQQNIDYLKANNPDWEHRLYDDSDIETYIKKNYPHLLKTYHKINPIYGAARVDFFRYLLIYNEGGLYLDIKSTLEKPLSQLVCPSDRYFLCHWQNDIGQVHEKKGFHEGVSNPFGELQQWHILAVAGHPFLKAVIENVNHNINEYNPIFHDTGFWAVLNLTGPIAYTAAIMNVIKLHPHRLERDNSKFGFIYSIYESQGNTFGHRTILKKHYSTLDEPLTNLPLLSKLLYRAIKPLIKITKNTLVKLR